MRSDEEDLFKNEADFEKGRVGFWRNIFKAEGFCISLKARFRFFVW